MICSYKLFLCKSYSKLKVVTFENRKLSIEHAYSIVQNMCKMSPSLFSIEHVTRQHKYFSKTLRNISGAYA